LLLHPAKKAAENFTGKKGLFTGITALFTDAHLPAATRRNSFEENKQAWKGLNGMWNKSGLLNINAAVHLPIRQRTSIGAVYGPAPFCS
jgi:hypothetical protein